MALISSNIKKLQSRCFQLLLVVFIVAAATMKLLITVNLLIRTVKLIIKNKSKLSIFMADDSWFD